MLGAGAFKTPEFTAGPCLRKLVRNDFSVPHVRKNFLYARLEILFQNKSKATKVQMGSKIYSGGILGGKAEKNTFLKASRTPQKSPWEVIWEPNIDPKPLWKRFQHATDIEERFGMVLGRLGHQFLSVFLSLRELR